jgi:hypothetical protein
MSGRRDRIAETLERFAYVDTPNSRRLLQKAQKYGLTIGQWENLGHAQEWKCASCGMEFSSASDDTKIDHCHKTGVVRGLLCHACNVTLGWAKDNPKTLDRLARYIVASRKGRAANR